MPIDIFVVTEGATEREVGKVLYNRNLLNQNGKVNPRDWKSVYGQSREGYGQVIKALSNYPIKPGQHILLIFDQEDSPSPQERASRIAQDLSRQNSKIWSGLSWDQLGPHSNLFKAQVGGACIVLHISNTAAPNITNRDFDGYILQLLTGPVKIQIASQLAPSGMNPNVLLNKAEIEFTNLMRCNGFPWQRNKAWLYAYITAFQFRQSHVWFAKKVVECAPENELHRVFAPLIYAWDWLVQNGGTC